jgi:hypothetical protein
MECAVVSPKFYLTLFPFSALLFFRLFIISFNGSFEKANLEMSASLALTVVNFKDISVRILVTWKLVASYDETKALKFERDD